MSQRFGDYQLLRYLTAGGMADLYLARQDGGNEELVLKRIQGRYQNHTHVVRLFIDEGRIARTLDHPNIVRTIDVGQLDGMYFIVMEYIPGHDLIAIARRGVEAGMFMPRPLAVGVVTQIASGLAYAHTHTNAQGTPLSIVHCDISPGNVVVSFRGTAKIVDFGIARATIQLRQEDGIAGKYNYMAPEQIRGERIDARADLFSLGVILYELTVGKRLFKGKPEMVRRKVLEGRIPRPREVRADYPVALEEIVMRLLERDAARRYPSSAALRSDLRSYLLTDERGYSKRDLAIYLRELFRAPLAQSHADEVGPGEEDQPLEGGMPHLDREIEYDPEEVDSDSGIFPVVRPLPEIGEEATAIEPVLTRRLGPDDSTFVDPALEEEPVAESEPTERRPPALPAAPRRAATAKGDPVTAGEIDGYDRAEPTQAMRKVEIGGGADPTALVRLPKGRRGALPSSEEPTAQVQLPDQLQRRRPPARRRGLRGSPIPGAVLIGLVVGAAIALLLLLALFDN